MTATSPDGEPTVVEPPSVEAASSPFDDVGPPTMAAAQPEPVAQSSSPPINAAHTPKDAVHTESHNDDGPPLPARIAQPDIHEEALNPQVASLQTIFPDFEPAVLQSVLESVGWDQDRAIDTLLGMNDPDYVPQHQHRPPPPNQTDLDEQLARRLMLEEEQQQQATWQRRHQWEPSSQPQVQRSSQSPPQSGQPGGRDTMAEFQDQFNKVAEVGKKTFSSIVSKVKAKMQEFDQSAQGQSSSSNTTPNWGGTGNVTYGQPVDRHAQQAYYAPNPYGNQQYQPPAATQGYDVMPSLTPQREVPPSAAPVSSSPPAQSETPRPPVTQTGPPAASIDPTKIGLLPKRPVSLVRDQPAQGRPHNDDEDLEYVENPFEERK